MNWIAIPRWPMCQVSIVTLGCGHAEVRFDAGGQWAFYCLICDETRKLLARCDIPRETYRA